MLLLIILALANVCFAQNSVAIHMINRRNISQNLNALLIACSQIAELAVGSSEREDFFASQGNIFDVPDEVKFYAAAARLPGVYRIGEIGFNAGHSTVTFLFQRHNIHVTSFDLGQMKWTTNSVKFVQRMFPNRLDYLKGYSTDTVPKYDGPLFDLFAIDGSHNGDVPYADLLNGKRVTKPGGYVLIDDFTQTNIDVKNAWARAKREGLIEEILCKDPGVVVYGAQKAYCLGSYTANL